nr:MAG TPA: major capsid protein [Caudoviricetes sp.]
MSKQYDFSGWATKNDLKCSDGRTIRKNAFKDCDGMSVPLIWNHDHTEAFNVLGHAVLENRDDGVFTYGYLNDTEMGRHAKELIRHGDITSLSIYANKLQQVGGNVMHGVIREVSLVLAPANPGAHITDVIEHSDIMEDYDDGDAYIECGYAPEIFHAEEPEKKDEINHSDEGDKKMAEKTLKDVIDTMTDEQKDAMYTVVGLALENGGDNGDDEEDAEVKHNVFDNDNKENTLTHAEMAEILADGKRYGSLKEAFLQHGIDNIETLFPDNKALTNQPEFYKRDMSWVDTVMNGVHHTPFSRIKSTYADITADEARAKGYVKGNAKVEEVISVLKRTTNPTTIYKKQKLDRDDVIDITDFDVVSWLKGEMRMMLNEELARAFLVGDGRSPAADDKINEGNIRPIWTDDDVYTIKTLITVAQNATDDAKAKAIIRGIVKSRKDYKGSGNTIFFTTEDRITDMLLMEDTTGRIIYDSIDKLATAMRVRRIVTVPVMEGLQRTVGATTRDLVGIIVDLNDYNVGADKGGAVNMFDDFDIDYNAQKYLIETRCSGALTKPKSAIAIEMVTSQG